MLCLNSDCLQETQTQSLGLSLAAHTAVTQLSSADLGGGDLPLTPQSLPCSPAAPGKEGDGISAHADCRGARLKACELDYEFQERRPFWVACYHSTWSRLCSGKIPE